MGTRSRCGALVDPRESSSLRAFRPTSDHLLNIPEKNDMKRFIIEREIPGASELTEAQLAEISKTSNAAVASLGVPYNWITSYVAGDKVYCVHEADDAETILEHARRCRFPANMVTVNPQRRACSRIVS